MFQLTAYVPYGLRFMYIKQEMLEVVKYSLNTI